MTDQASVCEYCGAPLSSQATVCDSCGQPAANPSPAQPAPEPAPDLFTPPLAQQADFAQPAASQPYSPPPTTPARKGRSALPVILGVVGCLVVLCIVVVVIGLLFFINQRSVTSSSSLPQGVIPQVITEEAVQVPAGGNWSENIGQDLSDNHLADDFSNNQYGWADTKDATRTWGIEGQHYSLHLKEADYVAWAYLPVDFNPLEVEFEAALAPGYEEGAYGVLCHYQDEDNYHYVAIDALNQEYSIGKFVNNEDTMLLDDWWKPATHLQSSSTAVNRVKVVCRLNQISLYINGQLETQVSIDPAFPGRMAVYAETWEDMPAAGFKVLFDNLSANLKEQ